MIQLINLTANYEKNPIGLTKAPVLQWQVSSNEKFIQKYFRIRISSDKSHTIADILDTGNIMGNEVSFNCENIKLEPFCRYFWSVEIANAQTNETIKSEPCEFVTSVLNRSQWTADIFRNFECMNVLSERRVFEIKDTVVEKAYIFIAASGEKSNGYTAYINGERIGDDLIMPGPMEYMSMRVRGYDITKYIKEKNVINIDHLSAISAVIKIFTNNETQVIQTDCSWEAYPDECPFVLGYENCYTPTRHHGKYELYDATKKNFKWYNPEYSFDNSVPLPIHRWGPIKLRYLPTSAISCQTLSPVSITRNDSGFIVDFGKIQSGFVKLTMHSQKSKVKIQYAEQAIDNKICTSQYANQYLPINEYIPMGISNEEYSPYFMHTSFRYVQITGLDEELIPTDIQAVFVHSDVDGKSDFTTDDIQLEYIYKCIQRSYKSNLIHIPTDCPGRERRGWTADAYAVIDSQCFMYNVYNLYDRWLEDLHDNQRMNGWCTVEYPDQTDPCIDINWPMHIVIIPWTIYEHYGNIKIIEKNIDSMEKYCELLFELSDNFLFSENLFMYGDWASSHKGSSDFIGACLFYYVNKLLSLAEKELKRFDLSEKYNNRSDEIKKAINNRYLVSNSDKTYYDTNSQGSNTLALMFDLCPEDKVQSVLNSIINDIEQRHAVTVGFIANTWLLRLLSQYGQDALAYRLITDASFEGTLAKMVNKLKNESLNESFSDTFNSLNHAFLGGGAASWIYRCYAGINILKPGYKQYEIKPYFAKQTDNFDISTNTPYGKLKLSWQRKDNKITIKVISPPSTKGTLILKNISYELSCGVNEFSIID